MRLCISAAGSVLLFLSTTAAGAVFSFGSDPFQGSNAPTTPGRQVVGGESSIVFDVSNDVFNLGAGAFGLTEGPQFANDVIGNIPQTGVNIVVLQTTDNDADPTTPFNAGIAANLIAARITDPGPGFFIYFNSGLDLPRLVFSTDLSDNTADLKILFRMTNLSGQPGALSNFTAANFAFQVPEPSSMAMLSGGALMLLAGLAKRRRRG